MRTRVRNRHQKHSMPFLVGFQVNEHILFHPRHDNFRAVLHLDFRQTARKSRLHDLSTNFGRHFLSLRRNKYSPFKSEEEGFRVSGGMQFVKEFILINYNCKVLIKLLLLIFSEYLSKFILVSLVRFCDAVGNSPIHLQV